MKKLLYKITVVVASSDNEFSYNFYKLNTEDFNIKLLEETTRMLASKANNIEYGEWHLQSIEISRPC